MKAIILSALIGATIMFGFFLSEGIMYSLGKFSYVPGMILAHVFFYGGICLYWKCLQTIRRWAHS